MNSTQVINNLLKQKKQNWQYVELNERDILLFKTILEQKFLTRPQVISHIFNESKSYAEIRIRKLKKFGYLKTVKDFQNEPECYLLTDASVEALREWGYTIGRDSSTDLGFRLPDPQTGIERAFYDHDKKVTDVRFILEELGFASDWQSEKSLRLGWKGERKVPDGFFTRCGMGIAIEVELNEKKPGTYRKIFELYNRNKAIQYVFYICQEASLRKKIMVIAKRCFQKHVCLALYDNLVAYKGEAFFKADGAEFKLKDLFKS